MKLPTTIEVTYKSSDNFNIIKNWFKTLDENYTILGLDFEVAVKYSDKELTEIETRLEADNLPFKEKVELRRILSATALSHPSSSFPTHLSIGLSESEARVIIIPTYEILHLVMDWLTTTEIIQVWHNASYDFKHIYYHTNKFPKNYEDTAQLAKSVLNHVEVYKAKVGLKELMSEEYGAWATSASNFKVSEMYEPYMLKYAATDACATIKLWYNITNYLKGQDDD
jgi:hypothetical protein